MSPSLAACRDALRSAGFLVLESPVFPRGFRLRGVRGRSGTDAEDVMAFGLTAEEAYLRLCVTARVSVPSLLSVEGGPRG